MYVLEVDDSRKFEYCEESLLERIIYHGLGQGIGGVCISLVEVSAYPCYYQDLPLRPSENHGAEVLSVSLLLCGNSS